MREPATSTTLDAGARAARALRLPGEPDAEPAPAMSGRVAVSSPATAAAGLPRSRWTLLVLAAITVVLGVGVLLAPVRAEQPVVTWPQADQPPRSTVLPLTPYRPLSLQAGIGCATLRAVDGAGGGSGGGHALRTMPPGAGPAAAQGLRVAVEGGQVSVHASGATVLTETLPGGDCQYQVLADSGGVRVLRDGALLAHRPDLLPPQVAELATAADPAAVHAGALSVRLRPDDRYASSPTGWKAALLVAHLVALAATLAVAVRGWPGRRPGTDRPGLVLPRPGVPDAVVVVVSVGWAVLGGMNWDDSWYLLMARNAGESGYLGNYIYMFNASENPFVASQYLLAAWAWVGALLPGDVLVSTGWELLWMRLLPLAYGLATWVLLRVLLATVLGRAGRWPRVGWLLLIAHLVWWLPYGMMLRPEPLIALGTAGVLVLTELARRRRSLGVFMLAVAVAALALTVSPTGVVAWTPLVVALPWLIPLLRDGGVALVTLAALVAGAAASSVVPVGFAGASLGEVLNAGITHNWYYLTLAWHEEVVHYNQLLTLADTGVWGRRAPVVLTLAVLVLVAVGSGRQPGSGDALRRLLLRGAVTVVVGLALLALTPTKWVNHFGAVSALGTVLLAAALLRSPLPRALRGTGPAATGPPAAGPPAMTGPVAATGAAVTMVVASALIFAGPNLWRPFSDWGQPFGDHRFTNGVTPYTLSLLAPHVGPVYLRNPLLWAILAALIAAGIAVWRRRGGRTSWTTERALLLTTCALSVGLLLAVFVAAPVRQHPGWTVAWGNVQALVGQPCGLANAVQVLVPTGPQPVPDGEPQIAGPAPAGPAPAGPAPARSSPDRSSPDRPPPDRPQPTGLPVPPPRDVAVWHTVAGEPGRLSTPWYGVPANSPATHLSVPVAAGGFPGQAVRVQFGTGLPGPPVAGRLGTGTSGGDTVLATHSVTLSLNSRVGQDGWQEIPLALGTLPGSRPDAVRIVVSDDDPGGQGQGRGQRRVAVAAPSLTSWQPVRTITEGQPVFADQLSAALWPCVDQVAIRHGIVEPPTVRLLTDDGIPEFILANPVDPQWGGSFVQVAHTATTVTMASRIHPSGPSTRPWGQVQRVGYEHPVGMVDLRVDTVVKNGWHRESPVTGVGYSGRRYMG